MYIDKYFKTPKNNDHETFKKLLDILKEELQFYTDEVITEKIVFKDDYEEIIMLSTLNSSDDNINTFIKYIIKVIKKLLDNKGPIILSKFPFR